MQKKKLPCVEAIAIDTLDDYVDIDIVYEEPSTKRKQASHTKVATKATKSKKTTSKEEHEDGEFGVSESWRDFDVEALISLQGEIEPDFVKNAKKQGNSLQLVHVLMLHVYKNS